MRRWLVLGIFLVSGAAGLVYQVAWTRRLALVLGVTSEAVSTVLAVFMGGLALGSWLLGRTGDRGLSPLRLYGLFELGIAASAAASPFLLDGLVDLYAGLRRSGAVGPELLPLLRVGLAAIALIVPTTLMGGTLPVLLKAAFRSQARLSRDAGTLYAVNTLGAVLGTLATAFVLIDAFGIRTTIWLAAGANAVVGLIALALPAESLRAEDDAVDATLAPGGPPASAGARLARDAAAPEASRPLDDVTRRAVLAVYGACGFLALAYEVLWTRYLIVVVGENSVYAFSLMLAAFLIGIVLGSALAARSADRVDDLPTLLGGVTAGVGISALATVALVPAVTAHLQLPGVTSFWALSTLRLLRCLVVLIVPTTLSGTTFALVARIYARDPAHLGRDAGTAYAVNTLGAILGALAGGFLVLPWLGLHDGLLWLGTANVAIGLALVLRRRPEGRATALAGRLALLAAGAFGSAWLASDVFQRASGNADQEVVFFEHGKQSTVAVVRSRSSGELGLLVDGDSQAGTHVLLQISLRLLGHVPVLMHPDPKDVLVIAFGAGITTGSALQHPIEHLDQVELSSSVIRASRFFAPFNHDPLHDPRLRLVQDDGRNYLLSTDRSYDVITSDPIDPDDAGVTSLYSKEYYELVRARLRPGGVAAQWIPSRYDAATYWMLVRTFQAVFPYTSVWHSGITTVVVGSVDPPRVAYDELARRVTAPRAEKSLAAVGIDGLPTLLALLAAGPEQTRTLTGPGPLNTDDHPRIEYAGPRWFEGNLRGISPRVAIDLLEQRTLDLGGVVAGWTPANAAAIAPSFEAVSAVLRRNALVAPALDDPGVADRAAVQRRYLDLGFDALASETGGIVRLLVGLKEGDLPASTSAEASARHRAAMAEGLAALRAGDATAAEAAFARASELAPELLRPRLLVAAARHRAGDARGTAQALAALRSDNPEVAAELARFAAAAAALAAER